MSGEKDLDQLLQEMQPEWNPGEYVFVTVDPSFSFSRGEVLCSFREEEGLTLILEREKADEWGLTYDFIAGFITLRIHSALDATGFTAAFSTALARAGISCNVVSGYYHDHLFVPSQDADRAMQVLKSLSAGD